MSKPNDCINMDEFIPNNTVCYNIIDNNDVDKDVKMTILTNAHVNSNLVNDVIDRKKKVRFPNDNEIVSDYFESKNYWMEHKFCSSEELINSYKKACDHCNVKPIPILLEQLKGIDAKLCHERYDMLNMSNVKLDLKQIECMEEIFKRVQFKTLNFENTYLDDESSASLFEIIEFYESCLKLNISLNSKISYGGFTACSKMLKKTPILECIEFKGIMFTDTTIPPLNRAMRCGSHLKVLHMENSNICSKNLLILTSALKLNVHLRELHLSSNRMVPSDGIQLGSLLKVNRHIEMLDVRNNSLGDIGLSHICDGLIEQVIPQPNKGTDENQGQGILCLILWSNSITHNGMPALSEALKASKSLQSLNLGNNQINSEGIHYLRDGLLVNRSLLRLSLPCCRITCEGGVAIAEYLADTKQLLRLDLRDNDIRTAGLMAISHSMKVNKSLIRLDVDQVSKRDPNVKGFMETQIESLRLIQDRIQENKKVVMKNQELELAHNNKGLSNNQQEVAVPSSDSVNQKQNDVIPDPDIPETTNPIDQPSTLEITSETNHIEENEIANDLPLANMSLPLSKDTDIHFDSPSEISNCFSNKILSPTDTILKYNLSSNYGPLNDFIEITNNSTTEDEDLILVDMDESEIKLIDVKINAIDYCTDKNDTTSLPNDSTCEIVPSQIKPELKETVISEYYPDVNHMQDDDKPQFPNDLNTNEVDLFPCDSTSRDSGIIEQSLDENQLQCDTDSVQEADSSIKKQKIRYNNIVEQSHCDSVPK